MKHTALENMSRVSVGGKGAEGGGGGVESMSAVTLFSLFNIAGLHCHAIKK